MLKIILDIIKNPHLLAQSMHIKKSFIIKVVLLIACFPAYPLIVQSAQLSWQTKQDLITISQHLPQFTTENGNIIGQLNDTTNRAIQTETVYFLYDIENSVSSSTQNDLTVHNNITFIVNQTQFNTFLSNINIHAENSNSTYLSSTSVRNYMNVLIFSMDVTLFLTPFLMFLFSVISILIHITLYSFIAKIMFLFMKKLVKWKHLWRVSLLASIVPVIVFSFLDILHLNVPYQFFITLLYILYIQYQVLKVLIDNHNR